MGIRSLSTESSAANSRCLRLVDFVLPSPTAVSRRRPRWRLTRPAGHAPFVAIRPVRASGRNVLCPGLHESAPPLKQVRACISRFSLVLDDMRQGLLGYVPRLTSLPAPVPKTGTKPVGHRFDRVIPAELGQRGVRQRLSPRRWKYKLAPRRKLLRFSKHVQRATG